MYVEERGSFKKSITIKITLHTVMVVIVLMIDMAKVIRNRNNNKAIIDKTINDYHSNVDKILT